MKNQHSVLICLLVCMATCFIACSCDQTTGLASPSRGTSRETATTPATTMIPSTTQTIPLTHMPMGTVIVYWFNETQVLTVTVSMTGLAPNSTHAAMIQQGSCATTASENSILYTFTLVADAAGNGTGSLTLEDIKGIPTNLILITVQNGSSLATDGEDRMLACGNITSVQTTSNGEQAQTTLAGTDSADEDVAGQATLSRTGNTLQVRVTLSGLVPDSQHIASLQAGTCAQQGPVAYSLHPVVVDTHGNGTSITTLPVSALPSGHISLSIYEAATMAGTESMATATGFNLLACGNK